MSLFGKKKEGSTKTIVIVDIGSGSVGCALAQLDRSGPPALLAQVRVDVALDAARSGEKIADAALKSAKEAMAPIAAKARANAAALALSKDSPKDVRIDHVAVFLPAPWSSLFLRNIRLARDIPIQIDPELVERMVDDYVKRERPDTDREEVIERSAVGIRLNGYSVADVPKQAVASVIELSIVSATAPKEMLAELRALIQEVFGHHVPITFHATSVAAAYALSVVMPNTPDYIFCNSEGEVTELLLTLEHVPSGVATATVGCNTILRTLSAHADMARVEASSALTLAKNERSPMNQKLSKTLTTAGKECSEGFRTAAAELVKTAAAARTIYIAGNGPSATWYADAVARAPFLKTLFPSGVSVEAVTYSTLSKFVKNTETTSTAGAKTNDAFLALEAIYADARFDERRGLNFKAGNI